jgi:hypothetical protein
MLIFKAYIIKTSCPTTHLITSQIKKYSLLDDDDCIRSKTPPQSATEIQEEEAARLAGKILNTQM